MDNKKSMVSIIIPTYNNKEVYERCLRSILTFTDPGTDYEVITIFNGEDYRPSDLNFCATGNAAKKMAKEGGFAFVYDTPLDRCKYIKSPNNVGWMGGINLGLNTAKGDYVLLMNDDTQIMDFDFEWLDRLIEVLDSFSNVGAVGPTSNAVMGNQNINSSSGTVSRLHMSGKLSGFCMLVRKELLKSLGGLDEKLCGGDDLDLSLQLVDRGHILAVRRDVFVYHNYATTGRRLHGNYWDSQDHAENIMIDLVKKHSLKKYLNFVNYDHTVGSNINVRGIE